MVNNPLTFLIDVLGWLGGAILLFAYARVSSKKWGGASAAYQLFNLIGSVFLILNTFYHGAYPSAVVNTIWVGIAAYALINHKNENAKREL